MPIFNNILAGSSGQATGYDIDQSLRFNRPDAPYLEKTFSASNRKTWTWSGWFKLADPSVADGSVGNRRFFGTNTGNSDSTTLEIGLNPDNKLFVSGWDNNFRITTALYRDPGSWYHCAIVFDSTDSTANDRLKLYINGERITALDTNFTITQDADYGVNQAGAHYVGYGGTGAGNAYCMDGYLAEMHFIDGQALTPASFGETNSATNQWVPIEVTGMTYGTNGFYQKYSATELANSFSDSHTTRTSAAKTMTANGNAQTDTSVKKFGSASYECSATGDFLSTPDSDDFNFGSGDFTISAWLYRTGTSSYQTILSHKTDNSNYWQWRYFGSGGNITFSVTGTGAFTVSFGCTDSTFPVNTWVHHEIVRDGNSWYLFQNGTQAGSTQTQSASIPNMSGLFELQGGSWLGQPFVGFMDEFHVSKGIARHTSNFSAPTTPDAGDANTVLLLHMNGANAGTSFPDDVNHTITANGDVANSRAQEKIGTSSIYFDGTGDYLLIPASSDFDFGSSDWTVECWARLDSVSSEQALITMGLEADRGWRMIYFGGGSAGWSSFRDTTATTNDLNFTQGSVTSSADTWYHVAFVRNGATLTFYVDGTSVGTPITSISGNFDTGTDSSKITIGAQYNNAGSLEGYLSGYMDEIRISNTARYTSSFTPSTTAFTADANTLLLIHSDFDGGLGADSSGNENDFSPTNLVATDQVIDSPTNNFATLNPLIKGTETPVFSEGNLRCVSSGSTRGYFVPATIPVSSGKWYAEFCVTSTDLGFIIGAMPVNLNTGSGYLGGGAGQGSGYYGTNGQAYNYDNGGTQDTTPATAANGDIIGVALDMDDSSGKLYIYRNNTILDTVVSGDSFTNYNLKTVNDYWTFALGNNAAWNIVANFGQDSSFAGAKTAQGNGGDGEDFYYTPPTGYKALNTDNLDDPAIALPGDYFDTALYTGNGSTQTISSLNFQPDLVWTKPRSISSSHGLTDSVRGAGRSMKSNDTTAEVPTGTPGATDDMYAFTSNGFSVGTDNYLNINQNTVTYASWNWKAGGTASSNTDGTDITSSVSANPTAGFSVVKWTGTGATDDSVGHGLSQAPELIIVKNIEDAGNDWATWHDSFPVQSVIYLNGTGAAALGGESGRFDTLPTASVFTPGSAANTNENTKDYIAYCFHSVEAYSKVFEWDGNSSTDGVFKYLGFTPAFCLLKCFSGSSTQEWVMFDNKRNTYNVVNNFLYANDSAAESSSASRIVDFVSNGLKFRGNDGATNTSGRSYIGYAVASSPFKYSNAR